MLLDLAKFHDVQLPSKCGKDALRVLIYLMVNVQIYLLMDVRSLSQVFVRFYLVFRVVERSQSMCLYNQTYILIYSHFEKTPY